MPHDVTMPQLGMAQDAGKIVSWFKSAGDSVAKGDALFEVETDKATMEVEAQADGFLTNIAAAEGEDVPVGAVIARISDSAQDDAPAPERAAPAPAAAADDALPEGTAVTMPQLGMAQDTGLLVTWLKTPGDAVARGDLLFEVETDKSTMEVEADADGYLAATLAHAGEDVPVGQAVAIISKDKPQAPVARGIADGQAGTASPPSAPSRSAPAPKPAKAVSDRAPKATTAATPPRAQGRILASPKARRIALAEGLDLARLAAAGHAQPFHVADLDALRALPADTPPQAQTVAAAQRFVAEVAEDGLPAFAAWAAKAHDLSDADAILAALAGGSLPGGQSSVIAITRHGVSRTYDVPAGRALSQVVPGDADPDLILRDLRGTAVQTVQAGAGAVPTLTLAPRGAGVSITLECSAAQMDADAAIALLSNFAGRVEHPLRHLL
ncbi:biotin/lipoyl-containing protein [Sulfitobacter sabulilitoris]|uniref:Pyruvate dehydrogenase n=1 Tax=Sulfitobacter sabulilitoris TaxID=2562655 RepID=A0A5S3PK43_9RHOB|nr:biotin/lipoyl-containing protein [Sulfitobacter sabulilitoris]TMM54753.1 pyruvate dehydrogenase [Sulfitobacter sabulilitoris]